MLNIAELVDEFTGDERLFKVPSAAIPENQPMQVAEAPAEEAYNQWREKHVYEDHAAHWNREWVEHNRNVSRNPQLA